MTAQVVATDLELLVLEWLNRQGIIYQFQTSLAGGYYQLGGAVMDFIVEPNLAWRIFGEYWHQGVEKTGSDIIQKEQLTALGYVVIDLLEDDLRNRLNQTLTLALEGQEMLR